MVPSFHLQLFFCIHKIHKGAWTDTPEALGRPEAAAPWGSMCHPDDQAKWPDKFWREGSLWGRCSATWTWCRGRLKHWGGGTGKLLGKSEFEALAFLLGGLAGSQPTWDNSRSNTFNCICLSEIWVSSRSSRDSYSPPQRFRVLMSSFTSSCLFFGCSL